jgi:Spy/CpxP family protein refolding chaperone
MILAAAMCLDAFGQGRPSGGAPGIPPGGYAAGVPGGPNSHGGPPFSGAGTGSDNSGKASSTMREGFQLGPVGRWWDDKSVVQTIGLRKNQQQKMDAIFSANKPAILSSYKTFLREQSKLNKLGKDPKADQTRLFAAIDAVSRARAALQKATTQMLLQIREQMDAEQIKKLEKVH